MPSLLVNLCKLLELASFYSPNEIVMQKKVIEDHEPLAHLYLQTPINLDEEGKRKEETISKSKYKNK